MRTATARTWCWLHKWTNLVCTPFLLMLCPTGLPLIFHDEIDAASDDRQPLPAAPANARMVPRDAYVRTATTTHPGDAWLGLALTLVIIVRAIWIALILRG